MKTEDFIRAYEESRNGANQFYRHPLVRNFAYSDGVQECAEAGCYWLIDIAATEVPAVMRKEAETLATLIVTVTDGTAAIRLTGSGDRVLPWSKTIYVTDLPNGEWVFLIADEGGGPTPFRMILITEY